MSMLRMPAVKAKTGFSSHSTVYGLVNQGLFPKPVQISERAVAWPEQEVEAINAARGAGKSADEIRKLVEKLHAQRVSAFDALA